MYQKILDGRLYEVVDIDKMQYWFMPGKGTVDEKKLKMKNSKPKISCFLYLLKRLLIIVCQEKLLVLLLGRRVPQNI